MKTYTINQFRTKEAVMDAIIDVFKRREDWTEAEARRTGINPDPTFKAQKAYDLAFQSMGGNSFRPGVYQRSKREMVEYLNNMESLFEAARRSWLRFYIQDQYKFTPESQAESDALVQTIADLNAKETAAREAFSTALAEFVEENHNCPDWRVSRFSPESVTFGLLDGSNRIDEKSTLTFYLDGDDEDTTLVTSVENCGRFSCEDVTAQFVRYAWMGLLLLDDRLKSLKEAMVVHRAAVREIATAKATANVRLNNIGLEDFDAKFEEYELQNW